MADLALPMVESEEASAREAAEAIHGAGVTGEADTLPEIEPLYSEDADEPGQDERPQHAAFDGALATSSEWRTLQVRIRADAPILPFQSGHSREGEQYRIARTKIIQHPNQPRLIVVSSTNSGDGKTVNAINLAGALALKSDSQVILVEGDMRRPGIASLFGLPAQPGLSEYLSGECSFEDMIVRVEQFPNLSVVAAGRSGANPTELLDSQRWSEACEELRRRSRFAIFDAPPMGSVADYDLIESNCDGVVFVVRPDCTNRKACLESLASISRDKLIGVLVNCAEDWFLWKMQDRYYYAAG
jgi:protein-tyrosine kinase